MQVQPSRACTVLVLGTLLFLVRFVNAADNQYEQTLSQTLLQHTAVLRNYYTDASLSFDSDGKLTSVGTAGFGPTDGRVYIQGVELRPGSLILTGQRTFPVYQAKGDVKLTMIGEPVKIEIAVAPDRPASEIIPVLLDRVFVPNPELQQMKCSQEEQQAFRQSLEERSKKKSEHDSSPEPPGDGPRQYCLPDGERAFRVGHGVLPPKALKTPDPVYPERARHNKIQATTTLLIIVDTQGRPTTLEVSRPAGHGFDEAALKAVQGWKFEPATLNGTPVPAVINVEMNFRLY